MLQDLLSWLPQDAGRAWMPGAVACAVAGLVLWLAGARVSRSVFTLVGVAAGAWGAMLVRHRIAPEVEPMGLACGGALVLGLAGYLLHTLWVGLTFGTLLGAAGVLVAWKRGAGNASWSLPALDLSAPTHVILHDIWASLPGALPKVMPVVLCGCFTTGVILTVLWPRLGRVLAFATLGAVMLVAGGVAAMAFGRPEWLAYFPAASQTQGIAMAVLVVAGAAFQWSTLPSAAAKPAPRFEPGDTPGVGHAPRHAPRPRHTNARGLRAANTAGAGRMKFTEAHA